jgi:hypothetical protein
MGDTQPPLEYLVACSQTSSESFLVSRSTSLTELRQRVRRVLGAWIQTDAEDRLVRQLLALEHVPEPSSRVSVFGTTGHAFPLITMSVRRRLRNRGGRRWELASAANPNEARTSRPPILRVLRPAEARLSESRDAGEFHSAGPTSLVRTLDFVVHCKKHKTANAAFALPLLVLYRSRTRAARFRRDTVSTSKTTRLVSWRPSVFQCDLAVSHQRSDAPGPISCSNALRLGILMAPRGAKAS